MDEFVKSIDTERPHAALGLSVAFAAETQPAVPSRRHAVFLRFGVMMVISMVAGIGAILAVVNESANVGREGFPLREAASEGATSSEGAMVTIPPHDTIARTGVPASNDLEPSISRLPARTAVATEGQMQGDVLAALSIESVASRMVAPFAYEQDAGLRVAMLDAPEPMVGAERMLSPAEMSGLLFTPPSAPPVPVLHSEMSSAAEPPTDHSEDAFLPTSLISAYSVLRPPAGLPRHTLTSPPAPLVKGALAAPVLAVAAAAVPHPAPIDAPPLVSAVAPMEILAPTTPVTVVATFPYHVKAHRESLKVAALADITTDRRFFMPAPVLAPTVPVVDAALGGAAPVPDASPTVPQAGDPRSELTPDVASLSEYSEYSETLPAHNLVSSGIVLPQTARAAPPGTDETRVLSETPRLLRFVVPHSVSKAEVEEVLGLLEALGKSPRITNVSYTVSQTHVRFYHASDAEVARAVAEAIGKEARDKTSFRPSPPEGILELYIAGNGGESSDPAPRPAPVRTQRQQPAQASEISRMRDRIVDRLRRGEHL